MSEGRRGIGSVRGMGCHSDSCLRFIAIVFAPNGQHLMFRNRPNDALDGLGCLNYFPVESVFSKKTGWVN